MAYTFDQIFAADPATPGNVAANASVLIFAPGDATKTPLTITKPDGSPLANPVPVNANGFGPAFMHATLDRVAWEGGGFTDFFTSYEGMKEEAVSARSAADTAAANAGAAAEADIAARIAAGEFKGERGLDGSNVLPTDTAIRDAINNTTSATRGVLNNLYALKGAGGGGSVTFVTLTSVGQAVTIPSTGVTGLALTQDGTGNRTVTWPTGIRWDGGVTPTLATTAGSTDVFTFVAVAAGGWLGSKSGTYGPPSDSSAPSAVTGLTAGSATHNSVPLSWTAATDNIGVAGYEYSLNGTTYTATGSTGTTYTVTGLTPSTIYTFYVRAYDAAGNRGTAESVVKTTTAAPADTTPPSALLGLTAGTPTATTIPLSWNASTDDVGVTGYEYTTNGTNWVSTGSTATSYTVTGLTSSTAYTVQVRAFDAVGNKGTAGSVNATTTGLTQVFLDTFTRADGQLGTYTSDTGQTWAGSTAVTYISGNKLQPAANGIYVTHGSTSPLEGTADITAPTTGDVKVSFRAPANATDGGSLVNITSGGLVALSGGPITPATITFNNNNGTEANGTLKAYTPIPGFTAGGTYAAKIVWSGSKVTIYIGGTRLMEGTYSAVQMDTLATYTSIHVVGTNTARIDNLKVSA